MFVNQVTREINVKLIYVGPAGSGKAENLRYMYEKLPADSKGKLVTVRGEGGDTVFFDMLPPGLGEVRGFKTRIHLYALDGDHEQLEASRLLLAGVDGIVFVADGRKERSQANLEALEFVKGVIAAQGLAFAELPRALQINRPGTDTSPDEVKRALGMESAVVADSHAGSGVFDTLKAGVREILIAMKENRVREWKPTAEESQAASRDMARVRIVAHYREFFGEGTAEYGPFSPANGRPPFYLMFHPATAARPYVTYATFGLSVEPQPAGGPEPRLELLAHAPSENDEVGEVLVQLGLTIAESAPGDAAFKAFDIVDFEDSAARFALLPAEEDAAFMRFPDAKRAENDLMFTYGVGAADDAEAQVTFLRLLPLTRDEHELASERGTRSLLEHFRGRPKSFGWGRSEAESVLRGGAPD